MNHPCGAGTQLQLALDNGDTDTLLALAAQTAEFVDWLEVGTPWILAEGMAAVRTLRHAFPQKFIVADLKIADAGAHEAALAFAAGADLVTVLGSASNETVRAAVQAAHAHAACVMVDMLGVPNLPVRIREVGELGAGCIGIHTGYDDQRHGGNPLAALALAARVTSLPLVVAGGLGLHNIGQAAAYHPCAIVVGKAVSGAADPQAAAKALRGAVEQAAGEPTVWPQVASWIETDLQEVGALLGQVASDDAERLGLLALEAPRVYVFGQGRSGLVMRMFAMRMMQIGIPALVVGDVTTPAIRPGDLLIVSSGSGETAGTVSAARHARQIGARVAAITARADSTLAGLADQVVILPGQSIKVTHTQSSRLPLANALEQGLLLLTDSIVAWLAEILGEDNAAMMARHANLE